MAAPLDHTSMGQPGMQGGMANYMPGPNSPHMGGFQPVSAVGSPMPYRADMQAYGHQHQQMAAAYGSSGLAMNPYSPYGPSAAPGMSAGVDSSRSFTPQFQQQQQQQQQQGDGQQQQHPLATSQSAASSNKRGVVPNYLLPSQDSGLQSSVSSHSIGHHSQQTLQQHAQYQQQHAQPASQQQLPTKRQDLSRGRQVAASATAPPRRDLFDDVALASDDQSDRSPNLGSSSFSATPSKLLQPSLNRGTGATSRVSMDMSLQSPSDIGGRASYAEGGASRCVTLFGFGADKHDVSGSVGSALAELRQCGIILRHMAPAGCNFLHVEFQEPSEAKRALSLNGTKLSERVMIGVLPCSDEDFVKAAQQVTSQARVLGTPRTRAQSSKSSANVSSVSSSSLSTPHKQSMLGSVTEYIFGWS